MIINYTLLETVEECDAALEMLRAEQTQIQRRVRNLGEALETRQDRTVEVSEGIASTQAIIAGFQSALQSITEGKAKRDLELKIEREETRLKSFENRQANYNSVSVIEDQVQHSQLEAQLPIIEDAIKGVETQKNSL